MMLALTTPSASLLIDLVRMVSCSREKPGPQPFLPDELRGQESQGRRVHLEGLWRLCPFYLFLDLRWKLLSRAWKRLTRFLFILPPLNCQLMVAVSAGSAWESLWGSCLIVWKLKTDLEQWEANCFLGAWSMELCLNHSKPPPIIFEMRWGLSN